MNVVGVVLTILGIGVLAYAGVTYLRQPPTAASGPHWTTAQQQRGKKLARQLAKHQRVQIPSRLSSASLPPAGAERATRLVIPKIAVDTRVIETPPTSGVWPVADWAAGHLTTTPNPGVPGNMALSAHDDIKGEIFKRIGELSPGDTILVYTPHAVYKYVVTGQKTVDPSDVAVLDPTRTPTLTLVTCSPYWVDSYRLIVQAALKSRAAA